MARGWLITGDVAKIDEEGAVILTDRSKDVTTAENQLSGCPLVPQVMVCQHITMVPMDKPLTEGAE